MRDGNRETADAVIHAAELEERCEYVPAVSSFLTISEQAELWRRVRYPHRLFFWGGFSGAERRCAVFIPEWAADGAPYGGAVRFDSSEREGYLAGLLFGEDAPFTEIAENVSLVSIYGSGHKELSHRDILGSLMGLGITRQSVGDICMVSSSAATVALSGKLFEYVSAELSKVGSDGVKVSLVSRPDKFIFERRFEELSVTVASMRLDGVVSAVTGMSRTRAAEQISAGLVQLSGIVCDSVASEVSEGDTISVRGYGKFLVSGTDGITRKSRIRVIIKKYI
ncbi:MAG: hypothetical protein E7578_05470 [Ruminococcaceae bacterium]|nr:hypothetical protein [Oscillospiraceae bacterium]